MEKSPKLSFTPLISAWKRAVERGEDRHYPEAKRLLNIWPNSPNPTGCPLILRKVSGQSDSDRWPPFSDNPARLWASHCVCRTLQQPLVPGQGSESQSFICTPEDWLPREKRVGTWQHRQKTSQPYGGAKVPYYRTYPHKVSWSSASTCSQLSSQGWIHRSIRWVRSENPTRSVWTKSQKIELLLPLKRRKKRFEDRKEPAPLV